MRAFIVACVAAIVIAIVAVSSLGVVQRSAAAAYSSDGARINPSYSLKRAISRPQQAGAHGECAALTTWQAISVDLGLSRAPDCLE